LNFIFALICSSTGLQWEELIAIIKMAKRNNPSGAGAYPETREGLLALERLDIDGCKLSGIANLRHAFAFYNAKGCMKKGRGSMNKNQAHFAPV
jgi:hypothetical protein